MQPQPHEVKFRDWIIRAVVKMGVWNLTNAKTHVFFGNQQISLPEEYISIVPLSNRSYGQIHPEILTDTEEETEGEYKREVAVNHNASVSVNIVHQNHAGIAAYLEYSFGSEEEAATNTANGIGISLISSLDLSGVSEVEWEYRSKVDFSIHHVNGYSEAVQAVASVELETEIE